MGRAFDVTPTEVEGREALMLDVPESVRCVGAARRGLCW